MEEQYQDVMKNRIPTKEEWVKQINSIVRGKVNYYLNVYKTLEVFMNHRVETYCNVRIMG